MEAEVAWRRLAGGGGSGVEVENVVRILRERWSVNSSDPRALKLWLLEQGIRLEGLADHVVAEAKSSFQSYQTTKRRNAQELVKGVLSGPNISEFFSALRTCPMELKEVAFSQALAICEGECLVLVLVALSHESRELIQWSVNDAPDSKIVRNFCGYLQIRRIASPSTDTSPSQYQSSSQEHGLEHIFDLISLGPTDTKIEISKTPVKEKKDQIDSAIRLLRVLPNDGYGEYLHFELVAFISVADPENKIGDGVVDYLAIEKDTRRAELIEFIGQRRINDLFSRLSVSNSAEQSALVASVLDVIRTHYPNVLRELPESEIAQFYKSKNVQLALSANAAALEKGTLSESTFVKSARKMISSDRQGLCTFWLARNPRYFEYVNLEKIPLQAWKSALQNLTSCDPSAAVRLLEETFARKMLKPDHRRWEETFKALDRIPSRGSDALFTKLAVRLLEENSGVAAEVLGREPAVSQLWRNIWQVSDSARNERAWDVAFGAVASKITDSAVVRWLGEPAATRERLRDWLRSTLLPRLLERQLISTRFLLEISDRKLQVSLTQVLTSQTVQIVRELQKFGLEWSTFRDTAKEKVASAAAVGLRIAIRAAQTDPTLVTKLNKLLPLLQQWRMANNPAVDASLKSVSDVQLPEPREKDPDVLTDFFSNPPSTPHQVAYFFGVNPWAVELYLLNRLNSWPNPNLILEQVAKSLSYFASLKLRSEDLKNSLDDTVRVELAIALRDELAEIEDMIAGYFAFRTLLAKVGLEKVEPNLGDTVEPGELSSERHKVIRDPSERGRSRIFTLGLRVGNRVVGSAIIRKSGEGDDRD